MERSAQSSTERYRFGRSAAVELTLVLALVVAVAIPGLSSAQNLRATADSMALQRKQAERHGFEFFSTPEEVYEAVRKIDPEVILIAHGAAMENPADAQYMLDHTSGHGFWTGSSTERLPIERAVLGAAREFAALEFRDSTEAGP